MELKTKRLLLREYTPDDWSRVHIYAAVPEFTQYEMWGPNSEAMTKKFIADAIVKSQRQARYQYELAVCLKDENLQIGGCGLRKETEASSIANLGWAMNPEFQNKGYTTEAAKAIIEYGFSELRLAVLYATCDTRNVPSQKVMEKLGMKRVRKTIGDRKIDGKILDSYRYEILSLTDSNA